MKINNHIIDIENNNRFQSDYKSNKSFAQTLANERQTRNNEEYYHKFDSLKTPGTEQYTKNGETASVIDVNKSHLKDSEIEKNKDVITKNYRIECSEIYLRIYDVNDKCLGVYAYEDIYVQKDAKTGHEVILLEHHKDQYGTCYSATLLDSELKQALCEATGKENLDTVPMKSNYEIKTHVETGIQYLVKTDDIVCGRVLFIQNEEQQQKLEELANIYRLEYSDFITSDESAYYSAVLEVLGLLRRAESGLIRLGQEQISYVDKSGDPTKNWVVNFNKPISYDTLEKMLEEIQKNRSDMGEFKLWKEVLNEMTEGFEMVRLDSERE